MKQANSFMKYFLPFILTCSISSYASTGPSVRPEGEPKTLSTKVLDKGADVMQTHAPLKNFDVYLVGFHSHKQDPATQMETHHFCNCVNEEFMQCTLFDGNTKDANLIGVEYIISEKLYETLTEEEKKYWHPHNYEILSGQLIAPSLPEKAEKALLKKKVNSYGKTWYLWHTKNNKSKGDTLPLSEAVLAWSFNHDNEIDAELLRERDKAFNIDSAKKRQNRQDLVGLAHPQDGVDALKDKFNKELIDLTGVKNK